MSEEARRRLLLDRIAADAGDGAALLRRLYAEAPLGQLEAAAARLDQARENAIKHGGRIQALWAQDKFSVGER
jgi:hypothetical protein